MARVTVIGAGGYVGRVLCRTLAGAGHEVHARARSNAALLLAGTGAVIHGPDAALPAVDWVVNLAYPSGGSPIFHPQQNAVIEQTVLRAAGSSARVVQVSTQAVFGLALDREPVAALAPRVRDYPYVEVKIALEHRLAGRLSERLHIVRLGNVWGPASPGWTAALAERLLFGRPAGVAGVTGFSNLTDVGNVTALIGELIAGRAAPPVMHLAEFADRPWPDVVDAMAALLGVAPVLAASMPAAPPRSLRAELAAAWRRHQPKAMAKELMRERVAGSVLRSLARALPPGVLRRVRGRKVATPPPGTLGLDDVQFLSVVCTPRKFASVVPQGWLPPVTWDSSWHRVVAWLRDAGFVMGSAG